jgi:predicted RNA-binding protein Jag
MLFNLINRLKWKGRLCMKSLVEEASSVVKAIEKAWTRAGKPQSFTVKIFEEPQSGFLGFNSKPAKIGIFYEEIVIRQEREHTQKTHNTQQKDRPYNPSGSRTGNQRGEQKNRYDRPTGNKSERPDRNNNSRVDNRVAHNQAIDRQVHSDIKPTGNQTDNHLHQTKERHNDNQGYVNQGQQRPERQERGRYNDKRRNPRPYQNERDNDRRDLDKKHTQATQEVSEQRNSVEPQKHVEIQQSQKPATAQPTAAMQPTPTPQTGRRVLKISARRYVAPSKDKGQN